MRSTTTGSVEGRMARLENNAPASGVTFEKVAPVLKGTPEAPVRSQRCCGFRVMLHI